MERKLTALLSADVKGYSRLMGEDEEATICTLTAYRTVMSTLIQQHRGRVVDAPGDNLLAEFASVVAAVRCAVEIQQSLHAKNAGLPDRRKMEFRIGINLGDVVVEGERIYGDGVNIAARIESLAEPGGICISGTVYEQIENKLALTYEYLGEQTVKNIAKPVRVWRVVMDEAAAVLAKHAVPRSFDSAQDRPTQREGEQPPITLGPAVSLRTGLSKDDQTQRIGITRRTWTAALAVPVVLLVGIGVVAMKRLSTPRQPHGVAPTSPQPAILSEPTQAFPLPDKPSIVILPFANLSDDPEQEYFSDGLTEDLTTDLSQLSGLFVIARNSAFTYKGKAVKIQEISRELGVRYVLEGSVRRADSQVRINAQLIDVTTGSHLWGERYDRPLQDIFTVQDEIVQKIVTTLKLQLTLQEQGYTVRKRTDNLEAYDYFLRGVAYFWRFTQQTNARARQMFEKAIELDPQYAEAHAWLGWTYHAERTFGWSADPQTMERELALAQQALALDDSLAGAHSLLSFGYVEKQQYDQAIAEGNRAIALDPNDAIIYAKQAQVLNLAGRPEEALQAIEKAMRLNPHYPPLNLLELGWAYRLMGRYEEAIAALKRAVIGNPDFLLPHFHLAIIYSELGQDEEARAEGAAILRISPTFSLAEAKSRLPFKDPAEAERYLAALRKAGLQ